MAFITDRPLTTKEFLDECIEFKRSHPVQSRFMATFLEGKLTDVQLRSWAKDMYHYVQGGIPALTSWLANAPTAIERDSARLVARNLVGELGYLREADHRDLYLKLLAGMGIGEVEAKDHLPLASTIGATSVMGWFCRSSFEEGLGSFGLGVELQVPGRPNGAEVILRGLRRYDIPSEALEFYAIHVEAEEEHGDNAERSLEPFTRTREQQALVRRAFRWTVRALYGMSSGFDAYLD